MKSIYILLLLIPLAFCIKAQSFEGKIVYEVDFEIYTDVLKRRNISRKTVDLAIHDLKAKSDFANEITVYIKGGEYVIIEHAEKEKKIVYKNKLNAIYTFEEGSDYVRIKRMKLDTFIYRNHRPVGIRIKPSIKIMDETKLILGDTCRLVKVRSLRGESKDYWFSDKRLKIDAGLFKHHQHDFLNKVLALTNAFPMEIYKHFIKDSAYPDVPKLNIVSKKRTVKSIEPMKLNDTIFEIPALEELSEDDDRYLENTFGTTLKKLKK